MYCLRSSDRYYHPGGWGDIDVAHRFDSLGEAMYGLGNPPEGTEVIRFRDGVGMVVMRLSGEFWKNAS